MKGTFKLVYIALLTALGLVLHIVEYNIPIPISLPGAKLGLANIASLLTIVIYGPVAGLLVSGLRAVLGGFLTGAVSSIPYGLSGALVSTVVMWLAMKIADKRLSMIGVSVLGAAAHQTAQICVASLILYNFGIFSYLPVLLLIGTATGYFTGMAGNVTVKILKDNVGEKKFRGRQNDEA